jgi:hypothetical protein
MVFYLAIHVLIPARAEVQGKPTVRSLRTPLSRG